MVWKIKPEIWTIRHGKGRDVRRMGGSHNRIEQGCAVSDVINGERNAWVEGACKKGRGGGRERGG